MKEKCKMKSMLVLALVFIILTASFSSGLVRADEQGRENLADISTTVEPTEAPEETKETELSGDVSQPSAANPTTDVTESLQPAEKTAITLNKLALNLHESESELLVAKVQPNDVNVIWKSRDNAIATVDSNGRVKAVKKGRTVIDAQAGEVSVSCTVTVMGAAVESVSIDSAYLNIVGDEVKKLTATVYPKDADNKKVSWVSNDTSIASVDSSGYVRGMRNGSTAIKVRTEDGGCTDTCIVYVTGNNITSISLNKTNCNLQMGDSEKLVATLLPNTVRLQDVVWTTSNTSIATVDSSGKISAVGIGTATITATSVNGGKKADCKVVVSPVLASKVSLDKINAIVKIDQPITLKATVYPDSVTNKSVVWSSSNHSVATVNENGFVTGVSYGKAKITATISGLTASCMVSVQGTYGSRTYSGGASYKGEMGNKKRNGQGTLIRANGTKVKGIWCNDKLISKSATVTYKNGDVFKGGFKNYVKTGKGTYTCKNGTIIKGQWNKNQLTGQVVINYSDGDKYNGKVKYNRKNGQGTYVFANGDKYKGKWKNDKMNGSGQYTFKNGSYYKGTFKNNRLTGTGSYRDSKGKIFRGKFNKGKMIKVISVK